MGGLSSSVWHFERQIGTDWTLELEGIRLGRVRILLEIPISFDFCFLFVQVASSYSREGEGRFLEKRWLIRTWILTRSQWTRGT